jgi:hypothetical protein
MKQFSAIVALAVTLGTMYGYILGQLASRPPRTPQSGPWFASEAPTFLLEGNIWGQIIFWSALPLFALFAWLTIRYVSETLIRKDQSRLNEQTIEKMDELFEEIAPLMSGGKSGSRETGR